MTTDSIHFTILISPGKPKLKKVTLVWTNDSTRLGLPNCLPREGCFLLIIKKLSLSQPSDNKIRGFKCKQKAAIIFHFLRARLYISSVDLLLLMLSHSPFRGCVWACLFFSLIAPVWYSLLNFDFGGRSVLSECFWTPRLSFCQHGSLMHDLVCMRSQTGSQFYISSERRAQL